VVNVCGFSLSDSHFLRREDRVIDFVGQNAQREVVGRTFSSGAIESWSRGSDRHPSPGVEAHEVDVCG
jgi:hypothetical protein